MTEHHVFKMIRVLSIIGIYSIIIQFEVIIHVY